MSSKKILTLEEKQKKLEQRQAEENENYMKGRPSRVEVANYVNSILEQKFVPAIMAEINNYQKSVQLGFMALQAILINKGVCTGEEIEEVTKQFIKQHEDALKEQVKTALDDTKEQVQKDIENHD